MSGSPGLTNHPSQPEFMGQPLNVPSAAPPAQAQPTKTSTTDDKAGAQGLSALESAEMIKGHQSSLLEQHTVLKNDVSQQLAQTKTELAKQNIDTTTLEAQAKELTGHMKNVMTQTNKTFGTLKLIDDKLKSGSSPFEKLLAKFSNVPLLKKLIGTVLVRLVGLIQNLDKNQMLVLKLSLKPGGLMVQRDKALKNLDELDKSLCVLQKEAEPILTGVQQEQVAMFEKAIADNEKNIATCDAWLAEFNTLHASDVSSSFFPTSTQAVTRHETQAAPSPDFSHLFPTEIPLNSTAGIRFQMHHDFNGDTYKDVMGKSSEEKIVFFQNLRAKTEYLMTQPGYLHSNDGSLKDEMEGRLNMCAKRIDSEQKKINKAASASGSSTAPPATPAAASARSQPPPKMSDEAPSSRPRTEKAKSNAPPPQPKTEEAKTTAPPPSPTVEVPKEPTSVDQKIKEYSEAIDAIIDNIEVRLSQLPLSDSISDPQEKLKNIQAQQDIVLAGKTEMRKVALEEAKLASGLASKQGDEASQIFQKVQEYRNEKFEMLDKNIAQMRKRASDIQNGTKSEPVTETLAHVEAPSEKPSAPLAIEAPPPSAEAATPPAIEAPPRKEEVPQKGPS